MSEIADADKIRNTAEKQKPKLGKKTGRPVFLSDIVYFITQIWYSYCELLGIFVRLSKQRGRAASKNTDQNSNSLLTGYQACSAANCRGFDSRGIGRISAQMRRLGALLAEIKNTDVTGTVDTAVRSLREVAECQDLTV